MRKRVFAHWQTMHHLFGFECLCLSVRHSSNRLVFLATTCGPNMMRVACDAMTAPASLVDLLDYPVHVWDAVAKADASGTGRMACLHHHLQRRWSCYSSKSGLGAWETSLQFMVEAGMKFAPDAARDCRKNFSVIEAWDVKPVAQQMLLAMQGNGPLHLFGDMCTKLNSKVNVLLDTLAEADGEVSEDADRAFETMEQLMREQEQLGALFSDPPSQRLCMKCRAKCCIWQRRQKEDKDEDEEQQDLQLAFAGITCKDFSATNKCRRGNLGKSGRVFMTWTF